jgi:osmotically-inducible protein OsmY
MTLGQQVIHHLLYERKLAIHFLEATVSGGEITLFGVASSQGLIENAINAARDVPGISAVHSDIQVVQEYNIVP